ncbi:MAG: NADH-quinone oxidoreductase subunit J [Peptococcaceae bacterium]|jgi:NADH:ubiquinone oxidoreductase subunit 6 (subunit J)|nr:NADH-quinone oxidoreductase subunit J [Peptococcaceae bacterium]
MGEFIAFIILAVCLLGSALLVVTLRDIVHAVLCLILVFFSVAGIFILLNADFLAVVQILVYAGGVSIMVVFGVMTVQRTQIQRSNSANSRFLVAIPVVFGTFLVAAITAARNIWTPANVPVPENDIKHLAPILLDNYVIPFEAAAILLTVAMTGALLLVKEVKDSGNKS